MTTNEKCIVITIGLLIVAAIVLVKAYADEIYGKPKQDILQKIVADGSRC